MLQQIEIRALRGATKPLTIKFEKGKRVTILYGENGSGKSSICDAIEFIAKGEISSLVDRGVGRTQPFWHSTGAKASELSVSLTTTEGTWNGSIARSSVVVAPTTGRPRAAILRRSQLLRFVTARAQTRYEAISQFINIEHFEASEDALKKALDTEERRLGEAVTRIAENRTAIESLWKSVGSPEPDAQGWAKAEAGREVSDLRHAVDRLTRLDTIVERLANAHAHLVEAENGTVAAAAYLASREAAVAREQSSSAVDAGEMLSVLEAAQTYFHDHPVAATCPLCESPERVAGLAGRIGAKLDAVKALAEAVRQRDRARSDLEASQRKRGDHAKTLIAAADTAVTELAPADREPALSITPALASAVQSFKSLSVDSADARLGKAGEIARAVGDFANTTKAALRSHQDRLVLIDAVKRHVQTLDRNLAVNAELEKLVPRMSEGLDEMREARRQFVDGLLKRIAQRVGELYERIHPGEGLSRITLQLDPERRASLDISAPFPGAAADAPPGAYLSDSHLDTLGLCIFLALAELDDPANTILVLDDVIASVDEPHVERVIEQLYEISSAFKHCLFATHYRPWREKFRWGWLRNGHCHFVELGDWDHAAGIRPAKSTPPIEELRTLLAAGTVSAQLSCSSAGVILEAILNFLADKYELKVPRRKAGLTLGDLLPNVDKKLRAALKIEHLEPDTAGTPAYKEYQLGPLIDELERIAQARNIFGAHFNEIGPTLPEGDARRFAEKVLALADLLVDVEAGWPTSDRSGSHWTNSMKTRRLHPLKQPQ